MNKKSVSPLIWCLIVLAPVLWGSVSAQCYQLGTWGPDNRYPSITVDGTTIYLGNGGRGGFVSVPFLPVSIDSCLTDALHMHARHPDMIKALKQRKDIKDIFADHVVDAVIQDFCAVFASDWEDVFSLRTQMSFSGIRTPFLAGNQSSEAWRRIEGLDGFLGTAWSVLEDEDRQRLREKLLTTLAHEVHEHQDNFNHGDGKRWFLKNDPFQNFATILTTARYLRAPSDEEQSGLTDNIPWQSVVTAILPNKKASFLLGTEGLERSGGVNPCYKNLRDTIYQDLSAAIPPQKVSIKSAQPVAIVDDSVSKVDHSVPKKVSKSSIVGKSQRSGFEWFAPVATVSVAVLIGGACVKFAGRGKSNKNHNNILLDYVHAPYFDDSDGGDEQEFLVEIAQSN